MFVYCSIHQLGPGPHNAHQPIGVPIEAVFPAAGRQPLTNREVYDKLRK